MLILLALILSWGSESGGVEGTVGQWRLGRWGVVGGIEDMGTSMSLMLDASKVWKSLSSGSGGPSTSTLRPLDFRYL